MIYFEEWYENEIGSENKPEYEAAKWAWEYKQAKFDKLQARVNKAMRLLQTRQHNADVVNIIFEMYRILKGNKDEN